MIEFVNAKINIGLYVTGKRPDGYHDLRTIFYPIGISAGIPDDPSGLSDILEITPSSELTFSRLGNEVNCAPEQDLVMKAARLFAEAVGNDTPAFNITLYKSLPDGAGMGGGSADATFTLRMLNKLYGNPFSDSQLADLALKLGADCPFFVYNTPMYGEGVGERLTPVPQVLCSHWALVVKPDVSISTREAFAGIIPAPRGADLLEVYLGPIADWRHKIENVFADSMYARHPETTVIVPQLYDTGALYASMTGSGSAFYAIFADREQACRAASMLTFPYMAVAAL